MFEKAKENWQRFNASEPGDRFEDRYHRRQRSRGGGYGLGWAFSIGGGIVIVLGGIVAVPGPGPGWLIIFLGLGMFAGESKLIARLLDWVEVRLREMARWVTNFWRSSSVAGGVLVVLATLVCVAAVGYGTYYLFFGG